MEQLCGTRHFAFNCWDAAAEPCLLWVCRQRAYDVFSDLQHELTGAQLLQLGPNQDFTQYAAIVVMQGSLELQTEAQQGETHLLLLT